MRTNREIALKTFDKYNGICQECGEKLIKNKKYNWVAHHINKHTKKEDYFDDNDRFLLCFSCHIIYHNKKNPKKNYKHHEKYILF